MSEEQNPYFNLWCAALRVYLDDAIAYYKHKKAGREIPKHKSDWEEAYRDLTGCGRMLERICDKTGHDPEYLRGLFQRATKGQVRDKLEHNILRR